MRKRSIAAVLSSSSSGDEDDNSDNVNAEPVYEIFDDDDDNQDDTEQLTRADDDAALARLLQEQEYALAAAAMGVANTNENLLEDEHSSSNDDDEDDSGSNDDDEGGFESPVDEWAASLVDDRRFMVFEMLMSRRTADTHHAFTQLRRAIFEGLQRRNEQEHRLLRVYSNGFFDVDNASYEQLLQLGHFVGEVKSRGMEADRIERMPTRRHSSAGMAPNDENENAANREGKIEKSSSCVICMCEYGQGDWLMMLGCGHELHRDCAREWLLVQATCPICRVEVVGPPPVIIDLT